MIVAKRRYEDPQGDEGYREVECPECGAPLTLRFHGGRRSRRLRCPVCANQVIVSLEQEEPVYELIRLRERNPQ